MNNMNGVRVMILLVGLATFTVALVCPWYRYRAAADVRAALETYKAFPEIAQGEVKVRVGMLPIWTVPNWGMAEWLPINIVQMLAIVALWWGALSWARQFDPPGPGTSR